MHTHYQRLVEKKEEHSDVYVILHSFVRGRARFCDSASDAPMTLVYIYTSDVRVECVHYKRMRRFVCS